MTPSSLKLPSELRNEICEVVLVCDEHIVPWADAWFVHNRQQKLTPGLFRTNKLTHDDACSLFYGMIRLDFTNGTGEAVDSFLKDVGPEIRRYLDPDDLTLEESSVTVLSSIKSACTNLSTLTTSLYSTNAMELRIDNLEHHKVVNEALQLVDTHFRGIPSLSKITLEVYKDGPNEYI